jgi:anti-sigma factor (TIGR02949 family)
MTTQLNCEDVIGKLLDYLDRELDADTQHDIERHLETCRGCFSRAEFERRLKARVTEAGAAKAPDSLRRRVRQLIGRY